jgi:hypothetical protein
MSRTIALASGVASYLAFLASFLYTVGFAGALLRNPGAACRR